ncbi:MAG: deoxyribose-phosphate aldolase [Treponemataceae bacterium]
MKFESLNPQEFAKLFDHTFLKPFACEDDFKKLCTEARDNNFAMVAINSYPVKLCKSLLKDTDVHVGAAISFPLGATTIEAKCFETENAIKNGADEIDYVINIGELKNKHLDYIQSEMEQIVAICRSANVLSKVIFENCYLTKDEIIQVAKIAKEVKPDFIKTSTGFGTSGAKVEDVKLMKETVGSQVKVKASGGIQTLEMCKELINNGVERIGCSNSVNILNDYKKLFKA